MQGGFGVILSVLFYIYLYGVITCFMLSIYGIILLNNKFNCKNLIFVINFSLLFNLFGTFILIWFFANIEEDNFIKYCLKEVSQNE